MPQKTSRQKPLAALGPLVGEWTLIASFDTAPAADIGARATFEWLPGEEFLIQRWQVPMPEAPDGIAVIGPDAKRPGQFLQHYFDTRGVARIYKMTFDGRVLSFWRDEADLSPLDFSQRYTGTLSADGDEIEGAWEICEKGGTWRRDFGLTFVRRR
jgi:hypothetical protein